MNWKKYPLIRLVIPLIAGMYGANCIGTVSGINNAGIIGLLIVIISGLIYTHKTKKNSTFSILTAIFFLIFGYGYEGRALKHAKAEYGDKWKYEIYRNNAFKSEAASHIQEKMHTMYAEEGINGEEGAVIESMTIGYRQNLDKDTRNAFSRSGLSHVLALSGFHISIIYIFLQFLFLGKLVTIRWKLACNTLTITALWAYAFIAGMQPSLVRAVIMCTIFVFSNSISRHSFTLNSCALAATIMLIIDPLTLFHVGFQLSFLAIIGISIIGIPLGKKLAVSKDYTEGRALKNWGISVLNSLTSIIAITVACNIFTLPIAAYTFHQIPLLSIISNALTTLLISALVICSIIWWLTVCMGAIHTLLTTVIMSTASAVLGIAHHISSLPFSAYPCKPNEIEMIMMYAIIITGTSLFHKPDFRKTITFLLSIIIWSMCVIIRKTTA